MTKSLNLDYLKPKLQKALGWSAEKTALEIKKYINFFYLCSKYPNSKLAPTPDIDEVWHQHILHTTQYAKDCEVHLGFFLHHQPAAHHDDEAIAKHSQDELKEQLLSTAILYETEFGEAYLTSNLYLN